MYTQNERLDIEALVLGIKNMGAAMPRKAIKFLVIYLYMSKELIMQGSRSYLKSGTSSYESLNI